MKILVIGAEGNVGGPLCAYLKSKGHWVMESDIQQRWRKDYVVADIKEPLDLLPMFDWKPEIVILLSAMVSRVTCEASPGLAISTNLSGVNNVLQLCRRVQATCVFFSTSEIYGPSVVMDDSELVDPKPNNRYGLTKWLGEQLVNYEVKHYGLKAAILRPFMIYDENETFGDHRSAMIRFAHNLAIGEPIQVHRGAERGWLHISDAVQAIESAMLKPGIGPVNIGHPDIRPMIELAEMIQTRLGAKSDLIQITDMPGQMTQVKRPILAKQINVLGIMPKVSLQEGVDRVCRTVTERLKLDLNHRGR